MQEWQEKIEQEVGQLREEVRQLREQRTEEMKAINVNVASADVLDRLDKLDNALDAHSEAWLKTLQENFDETRADILQLRESQADFRDRLNVTATKDDIADIKATQDQILALLQQRPPQP